MVVNCGVCFEDIDEHIKPFKSDACKHSFHTGCFFRWYQNSRTCPYCRQDIDDFRLNLDEIVSSWTEEQITEYMECTDARLDRHECWGGDPISVAIRLNLPERLAFFLRLRENKTVYKYRNWSWMLKGPECALVIARDFRGSLVDAVLEISSLELTRFMCCSQQFRDEFVCDETRIERALDSGNREFIRYCVEHHHADVYMTLSKDTAIQVFKRGWTLELYTKLLEHPCFHEEETADAMVREVLNENNGAGLAALLDAGLVKGDCMSMALSLGACECVITLTDRGLFGSNRDETLEFLLTEKRFDHVMKLLQTHSDTVITKNMIRLAMYQKQKMDLIIRMMSENNATDTLLLACQEGRFDVVMLILESRNATLEVDATTDAEYSPLCVAAKNDHTDIVEYLLDHGFGVHTDVYAACARSDILRLLLEHTPETEPMVASLMERAIELRAIDVIKLILERFKVVNLGKALFHAAQAHKRECIRFLLDHGGVDLDYVHSDNTTAFIHICLLPRRVTLGYDSGLVRRVLELGADPGLGAGVKDCFPLAFHPDLLEQVLDMVSERHRNLDSMLNAAFHELSNTWHYRSVSDVITCIENLLRAGAKVNPQTVSSCIFSRFSYRGGELLPLLISNGLDVNQPVASHESVLEYIIVKTCNADLVMCALNAGARVYPTLVHAVVDNTRRFGPDNSVRLLNELLKRMPDAVDVKDHKRRTALDKELFGDGHVPIIRVLLVHGARVSAYLLSQCIERGVSGDLLLPLLQYVNDDVVRCTHIKQAYIQGIPSEVLDTMISKCGGGGSVVRSVRCRTIEKGYTRNDVEVARVLLAHGKPAEDVFVEGTDDGFKRAVTIVKRVRSVAKTNQRLK